MLMGGGGGTDNRVGAQDWVRMRTNGADKWCHREHCGGFMMDSIVKKTTRMVKTWTFVYQGQ